MTETKTSEATRKSLLGEKDSKRTLRAADYLAVRHALPKTYLHDAILHQNISQDRHFGMNMTRIQRRQHKFVNNHDLARRTFLDQQSKKHRKWKRDDATRASNMNFPTLRLNDGEDDVSTSNAEVIYRSPRYLESDDNQENGQMLPYMSLRREATQLVKKSDVIYMTKLPSVVKIDDLKLRRYNTYCGTELIDHGARDSRHGAMLQALSSRKATPDDRPSLMPALVRDETNLMHSKLTEHKENSVAIKNRINFPSLTKRMVDMNLSNESESEIRPRSSTKKDVTSNDLQELLKTYGKLPSNLTREARKAETPGRCEVALKEGTKSRKSAIAEEMESGEDGEREFKSPSLQLVFTVKSNMK
ncbi:hypothetical protein CAPTEDRAFT_212578 [Capitella teleta]|uniref:Uncharacterized protein n=1 Tax=Capitella teleta TaxID=283909 RepID=R7UTW0_CAPTE|nr:hypothetical protein CAPTEDRAFT_212578 [Capitella teleta]|eukprot:ELU09563.1 hypothetical protein CAPTEDRAFT_212578 [Capitella teleta]